MGASGRRRVSCQAWGGVCGAGGKECEVQGLGDRRMPRCISGVTLECLMGNKPVYKIKNK